MLVWLNENIGLLTAFVGIVTMFAIVLSPIIALKIQKKLDILSDTRERKLGIFKTLMATRGDRDSLEHIKALNMIDVEFYNDAAVIESWNVYRCELETSVDNTKLFLDLLFRMAELLGYNFSKTLLDECAYSQMARGNLDEQNAQIRAALIETLRGQRSLAVDITCKKCNDTTTP